jgi:hypothetical protein
MELTDKQLEILGRNIGKGVVEGLVGSAYNYDTARDNLVEKIASLVGKNLLTFMFDSYGSALSTEELKRLRLETFARNVGKGIGERRAN